MPRLHTTSALQRLICQLSLACMAAAAVTSAVASSSSIPPSKSTPVEQRKPNPEELLIDIYKTLRDNRLQESLEKANLLVNAYPTFRLGHLLRGDLLMMHSNPVTTFGAAANGPQDKIKDLQAEAAKRIQSIAARPDPTLIPKAVIDISTEYKNVFAIDVARSRLYVYDNINGKLTFQADYYISQGKFGAFKTKEGDQRTPVGVYYVNERIPGPKLPDFYGPGALPINYPNDWDRYNKRNGYGIWLHGTASDIYSRPPLASDGCVVLSNQDLRVLLSSAEIGKTIVVIGENMEFVKQDEQDKDRRTFNGLLAKWQQSVASGDEARMQEHYAPDFRSSRGDSRATWIARQYRGLGSDATIRDVSLFHYPGQEDMMVTTLTMETSAKRKTTSKKRLYWQKEGAKWKIIFEGPAT
jgi:murein L,D-transpeptidase YafK